MGQSCVGGDVVVNGRETAPHRDLIPVGPETSREREEDTLSDISDDSEEKYSLVGGGRQTSILFPVRNPLEAGAGLSTFTSDSTPDDLSPVDQCLSPKSNSLSSSLKRGKLSLKSDDDVEAGMKKVIRVQKRAEERLRRAKSSATVSDLESPSSSELLSSRSTSLYSTPLELPLPPRVKPPKDPRLLPYIRHASIKTIWTFAERVKCISLSPDDRECIVSAWNDTSIKGFAIDRPSKAIHLVAEYQGHDMNILHCTYRDNGLQEGLASTGQDRKLILWDKHRRQPKVQPILHRQNVACCAFSHSLMFIAAACCDGIVRVYTSKGSPAVLFQGHKGIVFCCEYSPDDAHIASCGEDGTIQIWSANNGRVRTVIHDRGAVLPGVGGPLYPRSLFFTPDGKKLAAITKSRVTVYNAISGDEIWSFGCAELGSDRAEWTAMCPAPGLLGNTHLVVGCTNRFVHVLNTSGSNSAQQTGDISVAGDSLWSSAESSAQSSTGDGVDIETGRERARSNSSPVGRVVASNPARSESTIAFSAYLSAPCWALASGRDLVLLGDTRGNMYMLNLEGGGV